MNMTAALVMKGKVFQLHSMESSGNLLVGETAPSK
jgi:hypothetical protein